MTEQNDKNPKSATDEQAPTPLSAPSRSVSIQPTNEDILAKLEEVRGFKELDVAANAMKLDKIKDATLDILDKIEKFIEAFGDMSQRPGHGDIIDTIEDLRHALGGKLKSGAPEWLAYPQFEPGHNVACIIRRVNGALRLASVQDAPHPFWKDIVTGAVVKSGVTHWCAIPVFQAEEVADEKMEFPDTTVEGQLDVDLDAKKTEDD